MSLSRRNALRILGGGTILAATATGGFLATRTPARALAPWSEAGLPDDPRRRALSYAILSPNAHNRQPWLVDLSQPDTVVLHRDLERTLPETDPNARQLTISLGCFLETMVIAAGGDGYAVDLDLYPEGEAGPVAIARFRSGGTPDPLMAQILDRRSCKEPFDQTPVPDRMAGTLAPFATVIRDPREVEALRDLTWEAWQIEANTHRTMKESVDLMRFGKAEIEANPDGIDLGGPFLESLQLAGLMNRETQLDPTSASFQEGVRIYQEMLAATPAYVTLTSAGNSRVDQIEAGRRWMRLNLKTTELGLALHPVSQALQEFPEMAALRARAHDRLAKPGETVQMLGRLGFGPAVPQSPRWPLETRITHG
ncbi:MAG: twin-arginine translocation pathway signal protein [Pseudomonadota bacterium]